MNREETSKLKPGQKVRPRVGKYRGIVCVVEKVEMDAGAWNGWIHVVEPGGTQLMYTGEEVGLFEF